MTEPIKPESAEPTAMCPKCGEALRAALSQIAALREQLGREQRTMKFWAESYLSEHTSWGRCSNLDRAEAAEAELAALRVDELKENKPFTLQQKDILAARAEAARQLCKRALQDFETEYRRLAKSRHSFAELTILEKPNQRGTSMII